MGKEQEGSLRSRQEDVPSGAQLDQQARSGVPMDQALAPAAPRLEPVEIFPGQPPQQDQVPAFRRTTKMRAVEINHGTAGEPIGETLRRLYHGERKTRAEVAAALEVSEGSIRKWMKKAGIGARSRGSRERGTPSEETRKKISDGLGKFYATEEGQHSARKRGAKRGKLGGYIKQENRETYERARKAGFTSKLPERWRYILEDHYLTEKPATLEEIGRKYRLTRERVRQIEKRALRDLRRMLAGEEIQYHVVDGGMIVRKLRVEIFPGQLEAPGTAEVAIYQSPVAQLLAEGVPLQDTFPDYSSYTADKPEDFCEVDLLTVSSLTRNAFARNMIGTARPLPNSLAELDLMTDEEILQRSRGIGEKRLGEFRAAMLHLRLKLAIESDRRRREGSNIDFPYEEAFLSKLAALRVQPTMKRSLLVAVRRNPSLGSFSTLEQMSPKELFIRVPGFNCYHIAEFLDALKR